MTAPASTAEFLPVNAQAHIATMAVELRYIKEAVERIEKTNGQHLPRHEWENRNAYVDAQLSALTASIAALKADIEAKRAPWWSVVTSVAAIAALVLTVMQIV